MPATRQPRATRSPEAEDVFKRPEPTPSDDAAGQSTPAVPNLNGGPLEPEAWLALQQTIGNSAVGALVERRRASQPLPAEARHDMEASFGEDFGQVQLHSGPDVDKEAQSLNAAAFTVGQDIYVHSGLPGFDDPFGRQVLAEELAHVAQGVGKAGAGRVTAPDETTERAAKHAGAKVAAGQRAEVDTAPEAAGAVARFDIGDEVGKLYEWATGGETAARVERTELSDEDKDRLRNGAEAPLATLLGNLMGKLGSQGGKTNPKSLQSVADNAAGLSTFILTFSNPPAVVPTIQDAAAATAAGRNALLAAIDPAKTIADVVGGISATAATLEGIANAPAAAAPTPGATPADPSAPAAPAPESLSGAEADQLRTGAVEPLGSIVEQLTGDAPDLPVIVGRLQTIPGLLRSFTKPAAIAPQLARKAMSVEVQARALQAVMDGADGAIMDAISEWTIALGLLGGLTAKTGGTGAAEPAPGPSAAPADDDKNKPKP